MQRHAAFLWGPLRNVVLRKTGTPALLLLAIACTSGVQKVCRSPSAEERLYPFTGTWTSSNATPSVTLCLYQRDAQTVVGNLGNQPAVGIIHQDGMLVLSVSGARGVAAYAARLQTDTLVFDRSVMSSSAMSEFEGTKWARGARF